MITSILRDRQLLDVIGAENLKPRLDFSGSDLSGSHMDYLILPGADFSGTHLSWCMALFVDFQRASFDSADLSGCIIASQLAGASFADANLEGAIISGNVSKVTLNNARVALSCWVGAEFENPKDIKAAKGWENAFYADRDLVILGLPPDHNLKLVRSLLARYPILPPEARLLVVKVFEGLRNLAGSQGEMIKALSKPLPPIGPAPK